MAWPLFSACLVRARRLSRGLVQPDATLDLHGHNLATAYALLDDLARAAAQGRREA